MQPGAVAAGLVGKGTGGRSGEGASAATPLGANGLPDAESTLFSAAKSGCAALSRGRLVNALVRLPTGLDALLDTRLLMAAGAARRLNGLMQALVKALDSMVMPAR